MSEGRKEPTVSSANYRDCEHGHQVGKCDSCDLAVMEEWSNTIANRMPSHYDGDEAQETLIDRWLDDLATLVVGLRLVADDIFDGHLTPETADEDHAEPYCFECEVPWPCARAALAADLAEVTEIDDGQWNRSAALLFEDAGQKGAESDDHD